MQVCSLSDLVMILDSSDGVISANNLVRTLNAFQGLQLTSETSSQQVSLQLSEQTHPPLLPRA